MLNKGRLVSEDGQRADSTVAGLSNGDKRDLQQAAEWRPVRPESGDRSTKGIEAHMKWQGLCPGALRPICHMFILLPACCLLRQMPKHILLPFKKNIYYYITEELMW